MTKNWFEVDKEGLKQIQLSKPKWYVMRELVQNAWDEDIDNCNVITSFDEKTRIATIEVSDDSPEGVLNCIEEETPLYV